MEQQETGAKRRDLPEDGSKLKRNRRFWDWLTFIGFLVGPVMLWLLFWHRLPPVVKNWDVDAGEFGTLLQVVPATVVAVFVFAVGAVFVMVQIIGPTLGSRAMEDLPVRRRARACVTAGIVLLLACLALAALARIKANKELELWEASAASVLALASFVYVLFSIWCIVSVYHDFVSPIAYSELLGRWPRGRRPLAAERAFHQLRALRQWLRTACGVGESRDILLALDGFQELLCNYCSQARSKGKARDEELRDARQPEYSRTDKIVKSEWRVLLAPRSGLEEKTSHEGWFGDEFGRALARSAEVGMRSGQLLLRDLDRLLVVLGGATLQLAGFERSEKDGMADVHEFQELREEADFLLIRIAEIGMYACQVDNKAYSDWFSRPAIILASLENKLEILESSPERRRHQSSKQEGCLASRALAAWCLVNYILDRLRENASPQDKPTAHGRHRLGEQARTNPQLWEEAKRLAGKSRMHPSWMPHVWDEADSQQRLSTFVKNVQTLVFAKRSPQNLAFADNLDEWIIGGGFEASRIAAHWRDYHATVTDRIVTLRCKEPRTNGNAFLSQVIAADCYQGAVVTFKCRVKTKDGECQPQLRLNIFTWRDPDKGHSYNEVIADDPGWSSHEVTAPVPDNAEFIQFGLALIGPGCVEMRDVELIPAD